MAKRGRRGWKEELDFKAITDLSIQLLKWALKESNTQVKISQKIDIAKTLVAKAMPQEIEGEGLISIVKNIIHYTPINDKQAHISVKRSTSADVKALNKGDDIQPIEDK